MKPAKENSGRNNNSENAGEINKNTPGPGQGSSGKKEGKREFRNSRRWRKGRDRYRDKDRSDDKSRENSGNEVKISKAVYKCDICGKDIKEISSAIASPETQNPVHFDCIIQKLKDENTLENTDRIVYLGAGSFGIVRQEKNKPAKDFTIIKKIEFENRDEKPEWRSNQLRIR